MIIPIRCFSCGKVVGSSWEPYQEMLNNGKSIKDALDELKFKKFCCRSVLMSHVESIDTIGKF